MARRGVFGIESSVAPARDAMVGPLTLSVEHVLVEVGSVSLRLRAAYCAVLQQSAATGMVQHAKAFRIGAIALGALVLGRR